jgi:hypothetical protein
MSQPMLTLATAKSDQTEAQVHLLPCRIHHDGTVGPIEPYWSPAVHQGKSSRLLSCPVRNEH